jgi:hypothetical protein
MIHELAIRGDVKCLRFGDLRVGQFVTEFFGEGGSDGTHGRIFQRNTIGTANVEIGLQFLSSF